MRCNPHWTRCIYLWSDHTSRSWRSSFSLETLERNRRMVDVTVQLSDHVRVLNHQELSSSEEFWILIVADFSLPPIHQFWFSSSRMESRQRWFLKRGNDVKKFPLISVKRRKIFYAEYSPVPRVEYFLSSQAAIFSWLMGKSYTTQTRKNKYWSSWESA